MRGQQRRRRLTEWFLAAGECRTRYRTLADAVMLRVRVSAAGALVSSGCTHDHGVGGVSVVVAQGRPGSHERSSGHVAAGQRTGAQIHLLLGAQGSGLRAQGRAGRCTTEG